MQTVIRFYGSAALWVIAMSLLGVPVWLLMSRVSSIGRAISPPVYGIGLLLMASWYWAEPGGALRPMLRVVIVAGAAVGAVLLVLAFRRMDRADAIQRIIARSSLVIVGVLGMAAFSLFNEGALLSLSHPTVATLGNNDAPSYALEAQHLLDEGPSDPGPIDGYNVGELSIGFGFGSYATLAGVSAVTSQPVWKVMQPGLFALITLLALITTDALVAMVGRRWRWHALIATIAALGSFYPRYLYGNWFYGQFLGMLIAVALLSAMIAFCKETRRAHLAGSIVPFGFLIVMGVLGYPPVALLAIIVFAPAALLSGTRDRLLHQALYLGGALVGASALAFVTFSGAVRAAIEISSELADIKAGWRMPVLWPTDMVGIRALPLVDTPRSVAIAGTVICSLLVLVGWLQRERLRTYAMLPLFATVAMPVAAYLLVNLREDGTTYQLFKWIAFFLVPLTAAVILMWIMMVHAFVALRPEWTFVNTLAVVAAVIPSIILPAAVTFRPAREETNYRVISQSLATVADSPSFDDIDRLQVAADPYWDTMWLAYFLRDKQLELLSVSYYPTATPGSGPIWRLEPTDTPTPPGAVITPINDQFRLRLIEADD